MKDIKQQALDYYPKLWNESRIIALVKKGLLTKEDYKEITGKDYI